MHPCELDLYNFFLGGVLLRQYASYYRSIHYIRYFSKERAKIVVRANRSSLMSK
jgi:hypothetical protein